MDRRLFTTGIAAGALSGLSSLAGAFPAPYALLNDEDRNALDVLQRVRWRSLRQVFRNAPTVLGPRGAGDNGRRGVSLIVTPRLNTSDNGITLQIRGLTKNISRPLVTRSASSASAPREGDPDLEFTGNVYATGDPGLLVRDPQTQVQMGSGETLIIGSLMHRTPDASMQRDLRLPFIGDLPVVGHAFRSTSSQMNRRHLMIFITARIVEVE